MTQELTQHQVEIQRNRRAWDDKPLLREIYAGFYRRILELIDLDLEGRIVEVGSGIGNLKSHLPAAVSTDLFANPWLDMSCDGYELPFQDGTLSHLILFDVFHHLRAPRAFFREAGRVLTAEGSLILFEPFISWTSYPVYGLFHHEPVALGATISEGDSLPRPRDYYAAQGNATRLFFKPEHQPYFAGWSVLHAEAFASFSYLLSGGFSKPAIYPSKWLGWMQQWDAALSRWPSLFASRCLVALGKNRESDGNVSLPRR